MILFIQKNDNLSQSVHQGL